MMPSASASDMPYTGEKDDRRPYPVESANAMTWALSPSSAIAVMKTTAART